MESTFQNTKRDTTNLCRDYEKVISAAADPCEPSFYIIERALNAIAVLED